MAFEDAVTRLNSGNLAELWTIAALISTLEYFGGERLQLFPALSFEDVRLLAEAILRSRASNYRHRIYSTKDLIYVLNKAKDGLRDAELEGIESGRERQTMLLELNRILSRWGSLQLEVQRSHVATAGRAVAFFDAIPKALADVCRPESDCIRDVYRQIRAFLGCAVPELLKVLFLISAWYLNAYRRQLHILEGIRIPQSSPPKARAFAALQAILPNREAMAESVAFTAEALLEAAPFSLESHAIDRVLALWSRGTDELRYLTEEPAFKVGVDCWHLSPLHRYPIVRLEGDPPRYAVPNLRLLLHSMFAVLDYSLLEALPADEYNSFRGAVLEEYLFRLMTWAFPAAHLIREREYRPSKKELWKGPDVTFADVDAGTLIAVEAKTRRMGPTTRFQTDDESLDRNLADVHDALLRLPDKITHLRAGLSAYVDFQPMVDATTDTDPILVCVLPEAIHFLTQLERGRASCSSEHPLSGLGHRYCIMGLDDFEFAIACARHNEETLSTILSDFWEDAGSLELDTSAADLFRGRGVPLGGMFGEQFMRGIFGHPHRR